MIAQIFGCFTKIPNDQFLGILGGRGVAGYNMAICTYLFLVIGFNYGCNLRDK